MKRVLLSIAGTVIGIVALLSFKSHGHPISSALPALSLPGSTSTPSATPRATTSAPPRPGAGSSSAGTSAGSSSGTATAAGDAEQTPYGIVQVQVTLRGSTITNVSFLQLTAFDSRSAQINDAAAPILLQQTLSAQNANIDGVSGATYTSTGYEESLQSALDKAGVK